MKRKVYNQLLEWKREEKGSEALLIEGARRIGKSYIVEEFARNEYDSYLLIDFSKAEHKVHQFFYDYLENIDSLYAHLQVYYNANLTPRKAGEEARSLLIFDEVQFCPRARAAVKHLVADGRFDIIETGSLISIRKNVKDILIPSEERAIQMHPMDFEEYLWARGNTMLMSFIRECFEKKQPLGGIHKQALEYFREYMVIGGMPQAVKTYVETLNFTKVDKVKRKILALYQNDIHHYSDKQETKVANIFEEIPAQLQRHEKRFHLADLNENAKFRDYQDAFFWLKDAKIINCCYNATAPNVGLRLNMERTTLKCYMADTGLLISHAFDEREIVSQELYRKLLYGKLEINEGMLVENIVAQMLVAAGNKLYFYSKSSEKAEERMEIDFLLSKPNLTSRHNIMPVEVKSSTRYTLTSLEKCRKKFGQYITTPTVIHYNDVQEKDGILYLPIYMTPLL